VQEKLNELAVGAALLSTMGEDETLSYGPPLLATKKTIDFRLNGTNGSAGWVDVKTVSPEWADTDERWERFLQIAADAPENVHIVRDKERGGAGISNQDLKTPWTFVQRTFALEEKIAAFDTLRKHPHRCSFVHMASHGHAVHLRISRISIAPADFEPTMGFATRSLDLRQTRGWLSIGRSQGFTTLSVSSSARSASALCHSSWGPHLGGSYESAGTKGQCKCYL
jgi:hypothetical protein